MGLSGQIVQTLLQRYLGRGHILYTDNFYTSPLLVSYLHDMETGICGTVKAKRKHMHRQEKVTQKGEMHFYAANNRSKKLD